MRPLLPRLILVYLALLGLLGLTVAARFVGLGVWNPVAHIGITAAQIGLIVWFYMHLDESEPLTRIAALAGFLWIGFLMVIGILDWVTRTPVN